MKIHLKKIKIKNKEVLLTNQHAAYLQDGKVLILSDIHIGKISYFREYGIAYPSSAIGSEIKKLKKLIRYLQPNTIIIVGDLVHKDLNDEVKDLLRYFEELSSKQIILVSGNHDRYVLDKLNIYNLEVLPKASIDNIIFLHDEENIVLDKNKFYVTGHKHPKVKINFKARQSVVMDCFALKKNILTLPAFSEHAAGALVKNKRQFDRFYCIHDSGIYEYNPRKI